MWKPKEKEAICKLRVAIAYPTAVLTDKNMWHPLRPVRCVLPLYTRTAVWLAALRSVVHLVIRLNPVLKKIVV